MLRYPLTRLIYHKPSSFIFSKSSVYKQSQPVFLSTMTTTSPPSKKLRLDSSVPTLGTHNGHFHADEALAIFLLRQLPQYSSSQLIRTRDPETLASCTVVVDVGAEYDAARLRFDHHQRGFTQTFPDKSTKLSAAGLVWLHLGKDVVAAMTGVTNEQEKDVLWNKMYVSFVEAFDGNDNGIDAFPDPSIAKFETGGFTLAAAVARLNKRDVDPKTWLPIATTGQENSQEVEDARFEKASSLVGGQFTLALLSLYEAWLPARQVVRDYYASRFDVHSSGKILKLPYRDGGLPWMEHLYDCEADPELNGGKAGEPVLYVIFPETDAADSKWRIRAVSEAKNSFKNRKDLPDAWKGVRDEELSKVSGIPGCVFVHASGFIGGNTTEDGALQMAIKALD
jgi:uncharacterized UPF0160 family protein